MPETPRTCVAVYRRRVRASLERVWENVHDWEHLPWLHAGSFSRIDLVDSGPWGWRAMIDLEPATGSALELELVRDANADRYVARTLAGPGAGTEIWTSLAPHLLIDPLPILFGRMRNRFKIEYLGVTPKVPVDY